jgi:hypothetical protein
VGTRGERAPCVSACRRYFSRVLQQAADRRGDVAMTMIAAARENAAGVLPSVDRENVRNPNLMENSRLYTPARTTLSARRCAVTAGGGTPLDDPVGDA